MKIHNPKQYQYVFFQHMDFYAKRNGLAKPGRKLEMSEIRTMFDDVCEEIRLLYCLTETENVTYKTMMQIILFGKNKGRKGDAR